MGNTLVINRQHLGMRFGDGDPTNLGVGLIIELLLCLFRVHVAFFVFIPVLSDLEISRFTR
jgi:hypothetical protein